MLANPTFWILISFVVFVALFWRRISRMVFGALDRRSERIGTEITESETLLAEARALYDEELKHKAAADREIDAILAEGRRVARRIQDRADRMIAEITGGRVPQTLH